MRAWWHRQVRGHDQWARKVSIPAWDLSCRGVMIVCACGKEWVL